MRPQTMFLVALVALAGCQHDVTLSAATITKKIPETRDLDLLFVIDDSTSTVDKQTVFANNLSNFVAALDAFPGGRPNLHIGVVSTSIDVGVEDAVSYGTACTTTGAGTTENGLLQNTPRVDGCFPPNGRFISDIAMPDGTRQTNYSGTLASELACIGELGESGCGFESPMEAMKRALDGTHAENEGFLRDDADLGIVILTDEDDCSADPSLFALPSAQVGPGDLRCALEGYKCDTAISPSNPGTYLDCEVRHGGYLHDPKSYVDFLSTIKDPSQTVVAVIAGDPQSDINIGPLTIGANTQSLAVEPTCSVTINGNPAIARPALRLAELVDLFGDHGDFESVCQPDYASALDAIGNRLFTMMSPCLEGAVSISDTDPRNPGLQPQCVVSEQPAGNAPPISIPACAMTSDSTPDPSGVRPCWWVSPDASCDGTDTGLAITIERTVPDLTDLLNVVCASS